MQNTTADTYNGWTNRETWAMHLWLTNDEHAYHLFRGQSAMALAEHFTEECSAPSLDGFYLQVLQDVGSLYRVNWQEIAAALAE